jgi:hypothetical protein
MFGTRPYDQNPYERDEKARDEVRRGLGFSLDSRSLRSKIVEWSPALAQVRARGAKGAEPGKQYNRTECNEYGPNTPTRFYQRVLCFNVG